MALTFYYIMETQEPCYTQERNLTYSFEVCFQKHATIFPCFISQVFANELKLDKISPPVKSNIRYERSEGTKNIVITWPDSL